jgi:hypothetical protein
MASRHKGSALQRLLSQSRKRDTSGSEVETRTRRIELLSESVTELRKGS